MELKAEGAIITAQSIKLKFLGDTKKVPTLKELILYHSNKMKHILHKDTMRHFETSQRYIMEFVEMEYKRKDLYLRVLDYSFIIGFEDFLRSYRPKHYQQSIGNNTIMKHIQKLRKMVTMAYHIEWIDRDPFMKFKPKFIKKERDFLTQEELSCSVERLNIVKDFFIFSCYTGIAFGDIMLLSEKNIIKGEDGNLWIIANRQKTGTPVKIPLLPKALNIIEKQPRIGANFNDRNLTSRSFSLEHRICHSFCYSTGKIKLLPGNLRRKVTACPGHSESEQVLEGRRRFEPHKEKSNFSSCQIYFCN